MGEWDPTLELGSTEELLEVWTKAGEWEGWACLLPTSALGDLCVGLEGQQADWLSFHVDPDPWL